MNYSDQQTQVSISKKVFSSEKNTITAATFLEQLKSGEFSKSSHVKTIGILGFGLEGQSTYKYIRKYDSHVQLIIAEKEHSNEKKSITAGDQCVQWITGASYLTTLPAVDIIVKTPGIAPDTISEYKRIHTETVWITQTNVFLSLYKDRVIGVTGTKGKSTTSSLIFHILKQGGIDVSLVGNIGVPFFDVLDTDTKEKWYVAELSCHQLSDIDVSPHIAVLLNIYKDHLDYYKTFERYCDAKYNITKFQHADDICVFNADQKEILDYCSTTQARKLPFSLEGSEVQEWFAHNHGLLPGDANRINILAAATAVRTFGISEDILKKSIKSFQPLEYRLELIGSYHGIDFVDDALATIPEATIAALSACRIPVRTLIAGGFDRGQDYALLAEEIIKHNVGTVILFPTTGTRIQEELNKRDTTVQCFLVSSMDEAVSLAYTYTPHGSTCLLSPAAPSFSLFKNYKDRSDQYRTYVHKKGHA